MVEILTKEQEGAIIPYREYWINRILRTEQTDDEIKENINKIYDLVGMERPKQVWIMDSMYGVQVAINYLKNNKEIKLDTGDIRANIWANIGDNIVDNIRANIWNTHAEECLNELFSNIKAEANS